MIGAGGILHCTTVSEALPLGHGWRYCKNLGIFSVVVERSDVTSVGDSILHRYSCSCGAADAPGMGAEIHPSINSTLHCHEDAASLTRLITSAGFTVL